MLCSVVTTLVHVEGTFGLALFVANLAVKHLALVLMDIPNVNFESVFSWILSSAVWAWEIFETYKEYMKSVLCLRFVVTAIVWFQGGYKEITQNFHNSICLPQSEQQRLADVIIKLKLCRPMVGAHVNFKGIQTFCWLLTNLTVEGYASVLVNISYMGLKNIWSWKMFSAVATWGPWKHQGDISKSSIEHQNWLN